MNENTARADQIQTVEAFINEIKLLGKMTAADQARINEMARGKLGREDIKAINTLTALIRDGTVTVG